VSITYITQELIDDCLYTADQMFEWIEAARARRAAMTPEEREAEDARLRAECPDLYEDEED
jgi:hypothetical protein